MLPPEVPSTGARSAPRPADAPAPRSASAPKGEEPRETAFGDILAEETGSAPAREDAEAAPRHPALDNPAADRCIALSAATTAAPDADLPGADSGTAPDPDGAIIAGLPAKPEVLPDQGTELEPAPGAQEDEAPAAAVDTAALAPVVAGPPIPTETRASKGGAELSLAAVPPPSAAPANAANTAVPTLQADAPQPQRDAEAPAAPPETRAEPAAPAMRATSGPEPAATPGVAAVADPAPQASLGPGETLMVLGQGGFDWRLDAGGVAGTDAPLGRHAPVTTPPREIAQQLAVAIDRAAEDKIEIRLDPPELGRVQIELRLEDGRLHAAITAERPEVHDLMRRHADLLIRELEAAGQGRVSLDFASGSGERQGGDEAPPRPSLRALYDAGASGSPVASGPERRIVESGLDIRL